MKQISEDNLSAFFLRLETMARPKASPSHSGFASPSAAHLEAQGGAVAGSAGPSAAELYGAGWAALAGWGR